MRALACALAAAAISALPACASPSKKSAPAEPPKPEPRTAQAELLNSKGEPVGDATFTELKDGVRLSLRVSGIEPGTHNVRVDEEDCAKARSAPPSADAGGFRLKIGEDQTGGFEVVLKGLSLGKDSKSLLDPCGASITIETKERAQAERSELLPGTGAPMVAREELAHGVIRHRG